MKKTKIVITCGEVTYRFIIAEYNDGNFPLKKLTSNFMFDNFGYLYFEVENNYSNISSLTDYLQPIAYLNMENILRINRVVS
ncbi:hypothetical protein [Acinetobacter bereziniae]|uniref:hypothetical protein n=1 Tax=Acinetobacter bereziniae TaxID=106648 RepID=UPI00300865A9|nr:hypothetical protein [Acinetobacter bereziniae]